MRKRTGLIVLLIVVIIGAGLAAWWWTRDTAATVAGTSSAVSPSSTASPPAGSGTSGDASIGAASSGLASRPDVVAVRAVTVADGTAGRTVRLTGTVTPQHDVTLVAKVPGTVQWVAGEMGTRVEAGEPVVRLDDTELSLALAQSEAVLVAAEANLARLEAGAQAEEIAQVRAGVEQAGVALSRIGETLARQEQLFEQGIIPEETLLTLRTEYEVARLQYETAQHQLQLVTRGATAEERRAVRAQVQQAEVAVRLAEQQLSDTVVRTPFSGLLAIRPVQVGSLIGAGTPVAHVVDIDQVIVETGVSERDVNRLSVGQSVQVRVDALGEAPVPGVIAAIAPVADQQTRNFGVRVRVDNPDHRLKPGMIARVDVALDQSSMGPSVPQSAVVQRGGRPAVYVVETESSGGFVVRERIVDVGAPAGGLLSVTGVAVGEIVVLAPDALRDGVIVQLVELDGGVFTLDVDGGGI